MTRKSLCLSAVAALALLGAAGGAHAQQSANANRDTNARDAFTLNESQSAQVLELDRPRFGVKVEVQPPVTRETQLRDVEAGAYYKITPSIRVGGSVGLSDTQPPSAEEPTPGAVTPRVSLGATFKF